MDKGLSRAPCKVLEELPGGGERSANALRVGRAWLVGKIQRGQGSCWMKKKVGQMKRPFESSFRRIHWNHSQSSLYGPMRNAWEGNERGGRERGREIIPSALSCVVNVIGFPMHAMRKGRRWFMFWKDKICLRSREGPQWILRQNRTSLLHDVKIDTKYWKFSIAAK